MSSLRLVVKKCLVQQKFIQFYSHRLVCFDSGAVVTKTKTGKHDWNRVVSDAEKIVGFVNEINFERK